MFVGFILLAWGQYAGLGIQYTGQDILGGVCCLVGFGAGDVAVFRDFNLVGFFFAGEVAVFYLLGVGFLSYVFSKKFLSQVCWDRIAWSGWLG